MKKWIASTVFWLVFTGIAFLVINTQRGKGELCITVTGQQPLHALITGETLSPSRVEFVPPVSDNFSVSPLPYGKYNIILTFPEGKIELTVFHQNNWQKEHIKVRFLNESSVEIELWIEEELIRTEEVQLTPKGVALKLS